MPISDYAYTELHEGSGRATIEGETGQASSKGGSAQRTFLINWADLGGFTVALLGGWTQLAPTIFKYNTPDKHPDFSFWATSVSYEPVGAPASFTNSKSAWFHAKVTATYKALPFDPSSPNPSDIWTLELETGVTVISIDGCKAGVETIPKPTYVMVPTGEMTITLHNRLVPPGGSNPRDFSFIWSLQGKVNSLAYQGAAPGKLLFLGVRYTRTNRSSGDPSVTIPLKFSYNDIGWNKTYDSSGNLVNLYKPDGVTPAYTTADLLPLLP